MGKRELLKAAAAAVVLGAGYVEGDANGAAHYPDDTPYRKKFGGKYANRIIKGGIGHNLPQEAPQAFVEAIVDVAEV
jgi:hypothetical protein